MIFMLRHIIQINKDVVKVYYYTNVEEVWENIVYELLKCCRSIG